MNKELADKLRACKTAEEFKAVLGEKRLLKEDEMKKVVGRYEPYEMFQSHEEIDVFCDIVEMYIEYFGLDVATSYVLELFPSKQAEDYLKAGGSSSLRYLMHNLYDKAQGHPNGSVY